MEVDEDFFAEEDADILNAIEKECEKLRHFVRTRHNDKERTTLYIDLLEYFTQLLNRYAKYDEHQAAVYDYFLYYYALLLCNDPAKINRFNSFSSLVFDDSNGEDECCNSMPRKRIKIEHPFQPCALAVSNEIEYTVQLINNLELVKWYAPLLTRKYSRIIYAMPIDKPLVRRFNLLSLFSDHLSFPNDEIKGIKFRITIADDDDSEKEIDLKIILAKKILSQSDDETQHVKIAVEKKIKATTNSSTIQFLVFPNVANKVPVDVKKVNYSYLNRDVRLSTYTTTKKPNVHILAMEVERYLRKPNFDAAKIVQKLKDRKLEDISNIV